MIVPVSICLIVPVSIYLIVPASIYLIVPASIYLIVPASSPSTWFDRRSPKLRFTPSPPLTRPFHGGHGSRTLSKREGFSADRAGVLAEHAIW